VEEEGVCILSKRSARKESPDHGDRVLFFVFGGAFLSAFCVSPMVVFSLNAIGRCPLFSQVSVATAPGVRFEVALSASNLSIKDVSLIPFWCERERKRDSFPRAAVLKRNSSPTETLTPSSPPPELLAPRGWSRRTQSKLVDEVPIAPQLTFFPIPFRSPPIGPYETPTYRTFESPPFGPILFPSFPTHHLLALTNQVCSAPSLLFTGPTCPQRHPVVSLSCLRTRPPLLLAFLIEKPRSRTRMKEPHLRDLSSIYSRFFRS